MEIFYEPLRSTLNLLLLAGFFFGSLALLVKRTGLLDAMVRTRKEFTTNLSLALINLVLLAPLLALPSGAIRETLGMGALFAPFWESLPAPLTVLAAFLLYDFVVYWRHRFEHSPLLWRIHATHHADTALSWLSVQRKHPLSKLLSVCVDISLLLLLGLPEWSIGLAGLVIAFWGFFVHCDVPWTLGIFGKVLLSPAAHRLHHIRDEELMGTNYGNTLTLWDKMFGSYCDPTPYLNCETGIAEGTRNLGGALLRPFEKRYWTRRKDPAAEETEAAA